MRICGSSSEGGTKGEAVLEGKQRAQVYGVLLIHSAVCSLEAVTVIYGYGETIFGFIDDKSYSLRNNMKLG